MDPGPGSHSLRRRRHPGHRLLPAPTETDRTPWAAAARAPERTPLGLPQLPAGRRRRSARARARRALPLNATHCDRHNEEARPRAPAAGGGGACRGRADAEALARPPATRGNTPVRPFQGGDWCSASRLPLLRLNTLHPTNAGTSRSCLQTSRPPGFFFFFFFPYLVLIGKLGVLATFLDTGERIS